MDKHELTKLYIIDKKSIRQIAELKKCSVGNVHYWLLKHSIKCREPGMVGKKHTMESKKLMGMKSKGQIPWCKGLKLPELGEKRKGKNNPNYKHGNSRKLKEYQNITFNNLKNNCNICSTTNRLCVHHKDRDHNNNKINNLVILCRSCHARLHRIEGFI